MWSMLLLLNFHDHRHSHQLLHQRLPLSRSRHCRSLSFLYLGASIEYLLFLDADGIVEGKRFGEWLQKEEYQKWDALWFFAHCYGFLPSRRSSQVQQTALLVKRSAISQRARNAILSLIFIQG
jgi:hypothetical protein